MPSLPNPGDVVGGKYRVVRLLGQGGMGAVLEAEHELTKKRFAIKWMHPQIANDPDSRARFVREAQASARVRHPNIVDVYDVVSDGDALFLVMELLEGETLTALLQRGGMPLHELIALLLPALRAVAAAHRQGVVHRDLKPDNIFLACQVDSPRPSAKLLDFGISKVTDTSALTLTRTGAAMGTPMYMSVEQLCGDKDLDARADVYSLGVILYEAVTGRAPFDAESFSELAIKVATVEPHAPKKLRPDLPSALAALISACMAKKRENRLSSVDELVRSLEPFASEQSFRAKMTHPHQALPSVPGDSLPPPMLPLLPAHSVEAAATYARSPSSLTRNGASAQKGRRVITFVAASAALLLGAAGLGVALTTRNLRAVPTANTAPMPNLPAVPSPPAAPVKDPKPAVTATVTPNSEQAPPFKKALADTPRGRGDSARAHPQPQLDDSTLHVRQKKTRKAGNRAGEVLIRHFIPDVDDGR